MHSTIAIILNGKGELIALLNWSSWCLVMVKPALPRGATGLSAVFDCGISLSNSLTIFYRTLVRIRAKIGGSVVVDFLFIVTLIVGVCNCSMFCCTLLYKNSEYFQEIPQSQTADNPTALRGKVTQPSGDTKKTN